MKNLICLTQARKNWAALLTSPNRTSISDYYVFSIYELSGRDIADIVEAGRHSLIPHPNEVMIVESSSRLLPLVLFGG